MIELPAGRDGDLAEVAALADAQHRILRELARDAHAAGADDAALGVVDDGRPEGHGLGLVHDLLRHALALALMLEPVVLQATLAGLIADRAVDGVVQEQELLHALRASATFSLESESTSIPGEHPCWQAGKSLGLRAGT